MPTALIGGWHDVNLDQTLQQYERLRRAGCETALLVGPWSHQSALQQGWPEVFAKSLAWLRAHLCDDPSVLPPSRVRVHLGGRRAWQDLPDWPPARPGRHWYIGTGGTLGSREPKDAIEPMSFRYDPADPTPSLGGALVGGKAAQTDNRPLENRKDVLTFTTVPLSEPVTILGPVSAILRISTDTGRADVFARLCDVDPQDHSTNVCDGLRRLQADDEASATLTVAMSSTAYRFPAGHRIRLQISGGAHPRFARNTGMGEPTATATRLAPVRISLHHPSVLALPVADETAN